MASAAAAQGTAAAYFAPVAVAPTPAISLAPFGTTSFLPTTGLDTMAPGMLNHQLAYVSASIAAQAAAAQSFNGALAGSIPSPTAFTAMPVAVTQPGTPGSEGMYSNGLTQYSRMKLFNLSYNVHERNILYNSICHYSS